MADYSVVLTKTAQKQLDKLPDQVADMLLDTIEKLAGEPRPDGCKKLKGRSGYRVRKGDYRLIYDRYTDYRSCGSWTPPTDLRINSSKQQLI